MEPAELLLPLPPPQRIPDRINGITISKSNALALNAGAIDSHSLNKLLRRLIVYLWVQKVNTFFDKEGCVII
jgi:hypothetical protein